MRFDGVKITESQIDQVTAPHIDYGPRISRRSMRDAIIVTMTIGYDCHGIYSVSTTCQASSLRQRV